jgi:hypothetical protein
MTLRQTYTIAELEVTAGAYDEIHQKREDAGYDHAFRDGVIDMHGIGLTRAEPASNDCKLATAIERIQAALDFHGSHNLLALAIDRADLELLLAAARPAKETHHG